MKYLSIALLLAVATCTPAAAVTKAKHKDCVSSESGRFVTKNFAKQNPHVTFCRRVRR